MPSNPRPSISTNRPLIATVSTAMVATSVLAVLLSPGPAAAAPDPHCRDNNGQIVCTFDPNHGEPIPFTTPAGFSSAVVERMEGGAGGTGAAGALGGAGGTTTGTITLPSADGTALDLYVGERGQDATNGPACAGTDTAAGAEDTGGAGGWFGGGAGGSVPVGTGCAAGGGGGGSFIMRAGESPSTLTAIPLAAAGGGGGGSGGTATGGAGGTPTGTAGGGPYGGGPGDSTQTTDGGGQGGLNASGGGPGTGGNGADGGCVQESSSRNFGLAAEEPLCDAGGGGGGGFWGGGGGGRDSGGGGGSGCLPCGERHLGQPEYRGTSIPGAPGAAGPGPVFHATQVNQIVLVFGTPTPPPTGGPPPVVTPPPPPPGAAPPPPPPPAPVGHDGHNNDPNPNTNPVQPTPGDVARTTIAVCQPRLGQCRLDPIVGPDSVFNVSARGGTSRSTLFGTLQGGSKPDCPNYTEMNGDWVAFGFQDRGGSSWRKTASLTSRHKLSRAGAVTLLRRMQICFEAPYRFLTRPGYELGGRGGVFDGVLPDCAAVRGHAERGLLRPCVTSRRVLSRHGGWVVRITFRVPPSSRDPKALG
jgi:hypothetical protein